MLTTWRDLITSYNGTNITYDTIGNPTAIGSKELTWQGRELKSYFDGDYTTTTYNYNADGIRTRKEIYDADYEMRETHEYILSGSQIIRETVYLDEIEQYTLVYLYDELGAPIGIKYRTPSYAENVYDCYFFEKNLQGDIIAIYNASGTKIVTYTYDAWGNVTTTLTSGITSGQRTVANNNPFRYRGYYYDTHLEMYYLQSRYYNPEWGRFINADGFVSTGQGIIGNNMFAYCGNNPVTRYDPTGTFWKKFVVVAVVVVAIVVITTGVNHMVNLANEKKIKKEINDEYTEEESIDAIKEISEDISVEFRDNEVVITNAYKVKSRYDRQKISMIISRTGKLDREYDDFSSEWLFHKIAYDLYFMRGNAEPANIEYEKDERFSVRCITNTLEILGWE